MSAAGHNLAEEKPRAAGSPLKRALRAGLENPLLRGLVFWRGRPRAGVVALTFDDGPHSVHTPGVLDLLRQHGARATFFAIGEAARAHPELLRRIAAEGHAVASHTNSHADLSRLGFSAAWKECAEARTTLERLSGQRVRFLRPPWGKMRASTFLVALCQRVTLALWSFDSLDSRRLSADELAARVAESDLRPGEVLLFHDDGANTVEALERILTCLKERGLRCVTLDEVA